LSTKPTKKVRAFDPKVNFYMAEDLRMEVGSKVSAIGLYPDHVLITQLPDNVPDPTEVAPLMLASLGFLFNVSKVTESTTIAVDMIVDGERKPFAAAREYGAPEPGGSINLIAVMRPCLIASFGIKELVVTVGKSLHLFPYEIRRAPLPQPDQLQSSRIAAADVAKPAFRPRTTRAKAKSKSN
jgi:hypothetical protein